MSVTSRKMPCLVHFPSNDRNPTCLAQGSLSLEATLIGEGFTNQHKAWFACLTLRSWKSSTLYEGSTMAQDSSWKLLKFSSFTTCKTLTTAILLTDNELCCSFALECVFFSQVVTSIGRSGGSAPQWPCSESVV